MRYLVMLSLLLWASAAEAASVADIVDAGSLTTSNGLTFTNFHATLTYDVNSISVEGLVTTRQASLANLQFIPLPVSGFNASGFEITGFAWDATATHSTGIFFGGLTTSPLSMRLALTYTVAGLGGENVSIAPIVLTDGFGSHTLTATAPTGQQASATDCI